MKKIFNIIFILSINNLIAQNLLIKYERTLYEEFENGVNKICPTILYTNSEESYFLEDRVINGHSTEVSLENYRLNDTLGIKIKGDSLGQLVYKNLNKIFFNQRRRVAGYKNETYGFISDTILPKFEWSLKKEFDEILGYEVQKATTKYLDRFITAWFTYDISISNGPWKFTNLPGLILKVEIKLTNESYLIYEATSIKTIKTIPYFDFSNTTKFSLEEIEDFYKKKYKNQYNYLRTKTNGDIKIRKDDLDFKPIIYDSNQ